LGTNSIGWAFVHEAEHENEQSAIIRSGVRVVSLTPDESKNFKEGKSITTNAERRQKRQMRRNLDRYQLRREKLIRLFQNLGWIKTREELVFDGKHDLHEEYRLRAKAVHEEVSLRDLARILLMINKKRGYKSNRKTKTEEEKGEALDDMALALYLKENNLTPGAYGYERLLQGERILPSFYKSDLEEEFRRIWDFQARFYPEVLTSDLLKELHGQGYKNSASRLKTAFGGIDTVKSKAKDKKLEFFRWRKEGLDRQLEPEVLIFVLAKINAAINSASEYLGAISDRSKILHVRKLTVGEYLYEQLKENPHSSLRNQIFYRQDYEDEFTRIWDTQARYHPELTPELKERIGKETIFFQRPLKSQKGLIAFCPFESREVVKEVGGKPKKVRVGARVAPRSSPLFQEFKIWQILHNLRITDMETGERIDLDADAKQSLFEELNTVEKYSADKILRLLFGKAHKRYSLNYKEVEGNKTQAALYQAFAKMMEEMGEKVSFSSRSSARKRESLTAFFEEHGINSAILHFDAELEGREFTQQPSYQLWHLLYSYESDSSKTGIDKLLEHLKEKFGFPQELGHILAGVSFQNDYAGLSTKAMRKIFPYIKEHPYDEACTHAGYRHSFHITKEENENRILQDRLEILPKNSLRNPVVEKILNQMIHVVNAVMEHPEMGRPDEIRIELARELKSSAEERARMTKGIAGATRKNQEIRELLKEAPFHIKNPTRNDIIRYKLWEELAKRGYKTLYSDRQIPKELLFSKEVDVEHIIPKARVYDDSFSNKTLEYRQVNIEKGDDTAMSYIMRRGEKEVEAYKARVADMYANGQGSIGKAKYLKLLKTNEDIEQMETGFLERDLRDTQYIARKAKEILTGITRRVVSTTGKITDVLRQDWGLMDILKELNLEKYRSLGLTKIIEGKDGRKREIIIDWTKRNDHRHHAMDALVVAFTTAGHVQYINNLHARSRKGSSIYGLEQKLTWKDGAKRRFKSPLPDFRKKAKEQLEAILISHKAKNKVVTPRINRPKYSKKPQRTWTPRGQLHKETIYGSIEQPVVSMKKIGKAFSEEQIAKVTKPLYRDLLLERLRAFDGDAKKAFTGKNALQKNPIYLPNGKPMPQEVKVLEYVQVFTKRKKIDQDLKVDKVIDPKVRQVLQARLDKYGGDPKKAFTNLDEEPVFLEGRHGKIPVKSVVIRAVDKAMALRPLRDHKGREYPEEGFTDYVQTGNNHHVAIYRDANGKLQEQVVSFFDAVHRRLQKMPVVDRDFKKEEGWTFLFTLKENECFVFPAEDFEPSEIDLMDRENAALISPYLFRVQKISARDYWFRHHLESNVDNKEKAAQDVLWKRIQSTKGLEGIVKVRLNHLGEIVQTGEY